MYFNYSAEKQKLVGTWERLAKEYAAAGMSEEAIAQMKEYDMQWMRSCRRYAVHNVPLLDSPGPGEDDAPIHFLFNLPAKPEPFHSSERLGWLDEIEDEQLYKRLRKLKRKDFGGAHARRVGGIHAGGRGKDGPRCALDDLRQDETDQGIPSGREGRRQKTAKRERGVPVQFYVTPGEMEQIREKMRQMCTANMSATLRKMALDGFVVLLNLPELRELVSLMRRTSNNLYQIAKRANESGRVYETDILEIKAGQEKLWNGLRDLLETLNKIA